MKLIRLGDDIFIVRGILRQRVYRISDDFRPEVIAVEVNELPKDVFTNNSNTEAPTS